MSRGGPEGAEVLGTTCSQPTDGFATPQRIRVSANPDFRTSDAYCRNGGAYTNLRRRVSRHPHRQFSGVVQQKTGSGICVTRLANRVRDFGGDLVAECTISGRPAGLRFLRGKLCNPDILNSKTLRKGGRKQLSGSTFFEPPAGCFRRVSAKNGVRNSWVQSDQPWPMFPGRSARKVADFGPTGGFAIRPKRARIVSVLRFSKSLLFQGSLGHKRGPKFGG